MPTKTSNVEILAQTVCDYIKAAEAEKQKTDMMYKFLFVGEPEKQPPILPFVFVVKQQGDDIALFKEWFKRGVVVVATILTTALLTFGFWVFLMVTGGHVPWFTSASQSIH